MQDFYENTTKKFDVTITYNGNTPDIQNDTVTYLLKEKKTDSDADAKINVDADVATQGADGIAKFTLTKTDTKVIPAQYFYELIWTLQNGDIYILESGTVKVLDRIKEVV